MTEALRLAAYNGGSARLDETLPYSRETEMAVLGAMLLDADAVTRAMRFIAGSTFHVEAHRKIFAAMLALVERSEPIDIITLTHELTAMGVLADVGGAHYLAELNMRTPTAANVEHHARILYQYALKRELIMLTGESHARLRDDPATDPFDELAALFTSLEELREHRSRSTYRTMSDLMDEEMSYLSDALDRNSGGLIGVPTGYADIDRKTGGLRSGALYVIAGRTSMGKSALGFSIARNAAAAGVKVGIFSLEMAALQLAMRWHGADARVDTNRIATGELTREEIQRLIAAFGGLASASIFVDDTAALEVHDLRARARRMVKREGVGLIVVDYLGLLRKSDENSRVQEISAISKSNQAMAKEFGVPVVELVQINRSAEGSYDRRPMLSHLKDSGSIEEDADVVMLLYRPEYYGETIGAAGESLEGICEVNFAKNRHGATGVVKLSFIKEYARFETLSPRDDAPGYLPSREEAF
jgi:replicative DNA helicase